jgi:hypothetical protein
LSRGCWRRRTIPERRIDAGLPQIGRFEHVRVGGENQGQHWHLLSHLIARSTFGNRPIAVKMSAVGDPRPAAVKVGSGSTWAEPRCHANGPESALCSRWLTTWRMGEDARSWTLEMAAESG